MTALAWLLIAGGVCWIVSEVLELVSGSRTALTLLLTAAFHLFMVAGIWAAHAGQAGRKGILSRVGAGLASVGYLVLVYPPIIAARDSSIAYEAYFRERPLLMAAGLLVTVGITVLGAALLRSRAYPMWVGLACLVCPLLFAGVALLDGPPLIALVANSLLGGAFVTMGVLARYSARHGHPMAS